MTYFVLMSVASQRQEQVTERARPLRLGDLPPTASTRRTWRRPAVGRTGRHPLVSRA